MDCDPEVFDPNVALASVGGDPIFLSEVAGLFQAAWPTLRSEIRSALTSSDWRALEWSAHLVKTAATNISARKVSETALLLETVAGSGDIQRSQRAAANLEREVEKLQSVLATLNYTLSTPQHCSS